MITHFPSLLIVTPLIAAPICLLLRNGTLVRIWSTLAAWACLYFAWGILGQVQGLDGETIRYAMGGWEMPLGIELNIDAANAFVVLIITGIASVVFPFGLGHSGLSGPEGKEHLFYAAFLLCMCGLMGIAVTGDAFNVFVFLEITSLSSYALISMGSSRRALMAAYSYLIMGTIGGTFILVGIGFVYALTGTLNMVDIAERLPSVISSPTTIIAFGFLTLGVGIKLAIFPLYQWLPNAYSFAPSKVTAFLAGTATKVSYYVLLRLFFTIFGIAFIFNKLGVQNILMPLSLIAMFVGSIAAIYQTNAKRLFAYSSIAQIGYMTLGICLLHLDGLKVLNYDGLTGGIVHLFNHAIMKCGLFLIIACVVYRMGTVTIGEMKGFAYRMPWTFAAFVVAGLSIIGVPGTVGFVSKWYLVLGAVAGGHYVVAGLILLSSLLAVVYVWKIIEVGYFQKPTEPIEKIEAPLTMLVPIWLLMFAAIFFGFATELTGGVAETAAKTLLSAGGATFGGGTP
ncbi:MAG: monovalent cation/H+ antiporter subunit D family protein [Myxococcota bacterium]|nr:monovalent cation/H+ antiporter subunit D family protein [Myxococcota bacterium]